MWSASVLGPFFFILYMNDIVISANGNNIRSYADGADVLCLKIIHNLIKQQNLF